MSGLGKGITVDEVQAGNIFVVGNGGQPQFGVTAVKVTGREAETNREIVPSPATATYRVPAEPGAPVRPSPTSVTYRPPPSGARVRPSMVDLSKVSLVKLPVSTKLLTASQLLSIRLTFYSVWVSTAPGNKAEKVPPGIPVAPPPTDDGAWEDYYRALVAEMRALSAHLPMQYYGACKKARYTHRRPGRKLKVLPNRPQCLEIQLRFGISSAWGRKARAAFFAMLRSGQNPYTLMGALKVGLYDLDRELSDLTAWGEDWPAALAPYPRMNRAKMGDYLTQIVQVAESDYQEFLQRRKLVAAVIPIGLQVRPDFKLTPGVYPDLFRPGATQQPATEKECPSGTGFNEKTGTCLNFTALVAGAAEPGVTPPPSEIKEGRPRKPDTTKIVMFAGIGLLAVGGIYLATRKKP